MNPINGRPRQLARLVWPLARDWRVHFYPGTCPAALPLWPSTAWAPTARLPPLPFQLFAASGVSGTPLRVLSSCSSLCKWSLLTKSLRVTHLSWGLLPAETPMQRLKAPSNPKSDGLVRGKILGSGRVSGPLNLGSPAMGVGQAEAFQLL